MTDSSPHGIRTSGTQAEEGHLDQVLRDSDSLLAKSLRVEERRRRRRRLVFLSLLVGGIVMATTFVAVLAGWLTLAAPPPPEQVETTPSAQQAETKAAWIERLKGLRDHMHTAFGVGPDLTLLDPDLGLEIVRETWPKITVFEVKTGLLKTFAFSKALPEKHAKLFQVLHLGMTDEDPKVKEYAASYLKEYAGEDFSRSPERYAAWYRKNKNKTPTEVLQATKSSGRSNAADIERAKKLTAKAWQLWQQMQFQKAIPLFEQAVELDPAATNAWNGLGWARFSSGDSKGAITDFEKCVLLNPKHPAALNGLGQIYLNQGDYKNAERYLKKAAPSAPAAWFGLGRLYLLTGEYDDAQKWIRKALREKPGDTTLKEMLAAARAKELPEELRSQLEPTGTQVEDSSATLNKQGWREFFGGDYVASERTFRELLKQSPDHLAAINGLGFSLLNQGKVSEAKSYFEKYLAVEPDAPGPLTGLGRCLKAEGNVDEAIKVWERAYELSSGPNDTAAGLARAYAEKGEHTKAIPLLEELVKEHPHNKQLQKALQDARAASAGTDD